MNRAFLSLSLALCTPLAAQGLWIGPDQPGPAPRPDLRPPAPPNVHIARTAVHADVVDGVATTVVDQLLRNDGDRDAEGTWFLPLPAGAVADHFTMTVGGKEVRGEVLDAGQARSVYESIVRRRRDPGLLEYAGDGMLRARIFPIPARGEVAVTVRVRQVLQPTGGIYRWSWPLRAARLGDAAVGPLGLDVRIRSQTPLSTVFAPYANAAIRREGEHAATVTVDGAAAGFDDLEVLYGLAEQEFGLHLLPYRLPGEPGWFTMLVSPPRTLAAAAPPRRCVQLVVDTSGSMAGAKLEQAKAAVRTFLYRLRPDDLFQVITFASAVQTFFAAPQPATRDNLDAALRRVDGLTAMGGTNIGGALQQALESARALGDDGAVLLPQIVFVTDGQPTMGPTDPRQILELTRRADTQATRVFALGVGDDIDVVLLDDLVEQHRGARDFVRNDEKIEAKVDALCQKLAQPALTDVEVRCDGLDAFEVHPTRTRDLFCGEQLQVVGRYRNAGAQRVRVTGRQNGVRREFVFDVEFPAVATRHEFVQTLWARQHIAALLDGIRRNGARPELVDEVRQLATRYGIVTPYTSQLIVEEGMRLAGKDGRVRDREGMRDGIGGPPAGATSAPAAPAAGGGIAALGRARTGAEAVEESLATDTDAYELGATRREAAKSGRAGAAAERELVRRAAGRSFVRVGDDLVEQGLPSDWARQAVVVATFADAWFALAADPALRAVLALGDRIVLRDGERIVHVRPAAAPQRDPGPAVR
ncbi:MAG: VWA domain-containing protein [Planctomycetes bacterium]|nr:VWA domain-containing protein [Planctomycetota bacterium]